MQATACPSGGTENPRKRQSHAPQFIAVLDGNKSPIRGLWSRNGRFYAQIAFEHPDTGQRKVRRWPLTTRDGDQDRPVATVAEAKAAMEKLKVQRADGNLPHPGRTPKFTDYVKEYLTAIGAGQGMKKAGTISKEKHTLELWEKFFSTKGRADIRIDQIRRADINGFLEERMARGRAPRTVNLDLIALRNVLKRARENQIIDRLPTDGMKPLKTTTRKRGLFTVADLEKFCSTAFQTKRNEEGEEIPLTKNAQELVDYVRLLAFSGARRNEAFALKWDDVDFKQKQLTIGASGDTKNRTARVVDFNTKLANHLRDMQRRRQPDTDWMFPSPQRGQRDIAVRNMQTSLDLVRRQAGLPHFRFHDCRHHFISMCVMSGVDFMTIAAWVGHRDGGVLVGRVYGHLANEHRKMMAAKVAFPSDNIVQLPLAIGGAA